MGKIIEKRYIGQIEASLKNLREILMKGEKGRVLKVGEKFVCETKNNIPLEETQYINLFENQKNKKNKESIDEKKIKGKVGLRNIENINLEEIIENYNVFISFEEKRDLIKNISDSFENQQMINKEEIPYEFPIIGKNIKEIEKEEILKSYMIDIKIYLEADTEEKLKEEINNCRKEMLEKYKTFSYVSQEEEWQEKNKMSLFLTNNNIKCLSYIRIGRDENIFRTQNRLPFLKVLKEGLIKIKAEENSYAEMFSLTNINYIFSRDKEREEYHRKYKEIIQSFSKDVNIQFVINNELIDKKQKYKEMLCNENDNEMVKYYNDYLKENIDIAEKNAPERKIYLIVSVKTRTEEQAIEKINRVKPIISNLFLSMGSKMIELTTEEKIKYFYYQYNFDYTEFIKNRDIQVPRDIEQEDFISPSAIFVKGKYLQVGEVFKKTIKLEKYPSYLKDTLIYDIVNLPFEVTCSIHINTEDITQDRELVRKQILKMEAHIIEKNENKKKGRNSYISHETQLSYQDGLKLQESIEKEDERLFGVSIYVTIQGSTKKELELRYETLEATIKRHSFKVNELVLQQLDGIKVTSPVAIDLKNAKRTLRTSNLICLTPFSTQEIYQEKGIFYGRSKTEQLLVVDKKKLANSSSFILGVPGSGKSFMAKKEMQSVIFRYPNDEILIIDPENEYNFIKQYGGEIINISVQTQTFLNPLHITNELSRLKDKYSEDSPVKMKQESILGFIESLLNRNIEAIEKTLIDRIVGELYDIYVEKLEYLENPKGKISDLENRLEIKDSKGEYIYDNKEREKIEERLKEYKEELVTKDNVKCPNLKDLYNELKKIENLDAEKLTLELEYHVLGTVNIFSHDSNVNTNARIVCYNLKDIKKELKGSAITLVCEAMWERIVKNRELKKHTWIYLDEFHLLAQHDKSARFLTEFFKRVRKYAGIPCALTQNITDVLKNDDTKSMLANSEFKIIMKQSESDREELVNLFELSEVQADSIKNCEVGNGILIANRNVIPFKDKFPTDNKLYQKMNTRIE